MSDQKVAPAPNTGPGDAPPPYTPGQQGSSYPPLQTAPIYSQQPTYHAQSNAQFAQQMGPQPGSTFRYRNGPALIICQHCNATVTTNIAYEPGLLTWAAAGVVCLVGGWLGCCLIPFCIDSAKDVAHTCPNCNQLVGKFRQMS